MSSILSVISIVNIFKVVLSKVIVVVSKNLTSLTVKTLLSVVQFDDEFVDVACRFTRSVDRLRRPEVTLLATFVDEDEYMTLRMSVFNAFAIVVAFWGKRYKIFFARNLQIFILSWGLYHKTNYGCNLRFP
jgi:hypothetical protein